MVVIATMQGEHSSPSSFFGLIYDELVPPDHLLRRIAATVDFDFVSELVGDCYCLDNGRPSWDPLVQANCGPPGAALCPVNETGR